MSLVYHSHHPNLIHIKPQQCCSCLSVAFFLQQIRKLRRELESSQEKVSSLTTQLSANVCIFFCFLLLRRVSELLGSGRELRLSSLLPSSSSSSRVPSSSLNILLCSAWQSVFFNPHETRTPLTCSRTSLQGASSSSLFALCKVLSLLFTLQSVFTCFALPDGCRSGISREDFILPNQSRCVVD